MAIFQTASEKSAEAAILYRIAASGSSSLRRIHGQIGSEVPGELFDQFFPILGLFNAALLEFHDPTLDLPIAGAGGEFIPEIDFSSFGNVADPGVWSQVHDEGVQILENIANIACRSSRLWRDEPMCTQSMRCWPT
jgi:hypothetical protein